MDNELRIPFINPVKLVKVNPTQLTQYFTKHFDDYLFADRLGSWQQPEDYTQIWQTSNIINLQFESNFDPIIVQLVNKYGRVFLTLPALIGLPNKFWPGFFSFQVEMSLAGLTTGCYYVKVIAGTGDGQETWISGKQFISEDQIEDSLNIEYYHHRFHQDVIFETGIKFQFRVHGHWGFLQPGAQIEQYKNQQFNPTTLSSKTFRAWPLFFGDEYGLPDDIIDLLNRVWTCRNVFVDGKPFGVVDGKFDFVEVPGRQQYPKRGVKLNVEEGLNRNSAFYKVNVDTTKQLMASIIVGASVFGDLANQGSSNAVPITNVQAI